jgi:hypothetical protein
MTGQCLHHRGAISQWRLESEFELSWCARVAQRAKGSKKGGGQGQVFEGWSVGLVGCVSKDQAAAKNDRERQMTGFIVDNQAALNGTKKRRKGGQLRQSTAQQDLYQASSISYARSPRPSVLTNWQWPGRRWKASERLPDGGRVGGHWANGPMGRRWGNSKRRGTPGRPRLGRCFLRTKRPSEKSGESGLSSFSAICSLFVALRKEARRRTPTPNTWASVRAASPPTA